MNVTEAKDIADSALTYLASDAELVSAMIMQSGADPSDIRAMAARPEFSAFVLDFLLESDDRLLGFANASGIRPERVQMARGALGGFDEF